jgi:putative phage-type endonuclease
MDRIEWLQWRQKGIGSSDAPIIMGVSPYSTPFKLWEDKTAAEVKEDTSNQYIKDKGNRIEPKVREFYSLSRGFMSFEVALIEMQGFAHIRASLDGMHTHILTQKVESQDGQIEVPAIEDIELIEIKFIGKEPWLKSMDTSLVVRDRVPIHYWPQIQHQLMVTGAKVCHLLAYWDKEGDEQMRDANLSVVSVYPDHEYIAQLIEEEQKFWKFVTDKAPPPFCDRDYKTLKFKGATGLANKYKRLKLKMQKAEADLDAIKSVIVEAAKAEKHPRLTLAGLKVFEVEKDGSVDYKTLAEACAWNSKLFWSNLPREIADKMVADGTPKKTSDIELYRKKGSKSWTIKIEKEKKNEAEVR